MYGESGAFPHPEPEHRREQQFHGGVDVEIGRESPASVKPGI